MIRNEKGLRRDILCAIEHFGSFEKAQEYIAGEFKGEYSAEEITETFAEIKKVYPEE